MSNRQYITELIVNADAARVEPMRDRLVEIAHLLTRINQLGGAGALGGGAGGGAAFGAAPGGFQGAGGAGGGPWGGGGFHGGGGAGGGAAGGAGGTFGAGGGMAGSGEDDGDDQKGGGWRRWQQRLTAAGRFARPDEGIMVAAAGVAAGVLTLGLAKGFGEAIAQDFIKVSNKALALDEARSVSRGLLGGEVGRGLAGGWNTRGFGAEALGFDPMKTEQILQTTIGAGLNRDATSVLALQALQMERVGIGAGPLAQFAEMFRTGGGAAVGSSTGNAGADAMRTMGLVFAEGTRMGIERSRLADLMGIVAQATTAMRDRGVDADPQAFLARAALLQHMAGGAASMAGTRSAEMEARLEGMGREVLGGGGSPLVQREMLRAAGLGQIDPATGRRRGLLDAMTRLEAGDIDPGIIVEDFRRGGNAEGNALLMGMMGFAGFGQARDLVSGPKRRGFEFDVNERAMSGISGLAGAAAGATSGYQQRQAAIERGEIEAGEAALPTYMWVREQLASVRQEATMFVAQLPNEISDLIDKMKGFFGVGGNPVREEMERIREERENQQRAPRQVPGVTEPPPEKGDKGAFLLPRRVILELSPEAERFFVLREVPA